LLFGTSCAYVRTLEGIAEKRGENAEIKDAGQKRYRANNGDNNAYCTAETPNAPGD
jgi:hypothetical protein